MESQIVQSAAVTLVFVTRFGPECLYRLEYALGGGGGGQAVQGQRK